MTAETQVPAAQAQASPLSPPSLREYRVLVTGSREWTDPNLVGRALNSALALLQVPVTVQDRISLIHGAAKGLDSLAAQVAGSRGWKTEAHPAQWQTHTAACPARHQGEKTCKMAGHRRNHEMIALGADLVLSFPLGTEESGHSKGTWGCTRAAMNAGLPTVVLWHERFHPWGAKAGELILAELTAASMNTAPLTAGPVPLDSLRPLPF